MKKLRLILLCCTVCALLLSSCSSKSKVTATADTTSSTYLSKDLSIDNPSTDYSLPASSQQLSSPTVASSAPSVNTSKKPTATSSKTTTSSKKASTSSAPLASPGDNAVNMVPSFQTTSDGLSASQPLFGATARAATPQELYTRYSASLTKTLATNNFALTKSETLVLNGYYVATNSDTLSVYQVNGKNSFAQSTKQFFTDNGGVPISNSLVKHFYDGTTNKLYTDVVSATDNVTSSDAFLFSLPSECSSIYDKSITTATSTSSDLTYYTFTLDPNLYVSFLPNAVKSLAGGNIDVDTSSANISLMKFTASVNSDGYIVNQTTVVDYTNGSDLCHYKNVVNFSSVNSNPEQPAPSYVVKK